MPRALKWMRTPFQWDCSDSAPPPAPHDALAADPLLQGIAIVAVRCRRQCAVIVGEASDQAAPMFMHRALVGRQIGGGDAAVQEPTGLSAGGPRGIPTPRAVMHATPLTRFAQISNRVTQPMSPRGLIRQIGTVLTLRNRM
jgi:hypothetical protein